MKCVIEYCLMFAESAKSVIDEYDKYIGQYGTINIGKYITTEEGQTDYMGTC